MRLRVLIAAANPLFLAGYRVFLTPEGVEVVTASNWEECQAALCQAPVDLLILDPEALAGTPDALSFARDGSQGEWKVPPVLLLTSHPDLWTDKVAPLGNCGLLIKPVLPATVANFVHAFLDQDQADRELVLR